MANLGELTESQRNDLKNQISAWEAAKENLKNALKSLYFCWNQFNEIQGQIGKCNPPEGMEDNWLEIGSINEEIISKINGVNNDSPNISTIENAVNELIDNYNERIEHNNSLLGNGTQIDG